MAKASIDVITALRQCADALAESNHYQWGYMGSCNCGFLAQQITHMRREEIHSAAMQGNGEWGEQLKDYCPTSGLTMDNLIYKMFSFGFNSDDLRNLEKLSDSEILAKLHLDRRDIKYNIKAHVVAYQKPGLFF